MCTQHGKSQLAQAAWNVLDVVPVRLAICFLTHSRNASLASNTLSLDPFTIRQSVGLRDANIGQQHPLALVDDAVHHLACVHNRRRMRVPVVVVGVVAV
jgi:hypothetical protein